MNVLIKKAVLLFLCFSAVHDNQAQQRFSPYEWGLNIGLMVYQGDLSVGRVGSLRTQKPYFDLHATRLLGDAFSIRANLAVGELYGDDAKYENPDYKRHRNFNFKSPVYELSLRVLWDPLGRNNNIVGFAPYVFGGAGLALLNIRRDWSRLDKDYFPLNADVLTQIPADSAKVLPGSIPVFPVGAGVKYFLSPQLALNAELGYRLTATDYLDGFSKSANPNFRDSYFTYGVGIIYRPGKRDPMDCPTPKY